MVYFCSIPLALLLFLLDFPQIQATPASYMIHTLTPRTALTSAISRLWSSKNDVQQIITATDVYVTLSTSCNTSTDVQVAATLSQPSRHLYITVRPSSAPSFTRIVRLAVAVDASTQVRVHVSAGRVMLSLRVLEAVVNGIVHRCQGQEDCLKEAVRARCGETWVGERCDETCSRRSLRRCQGDGGLGDLLRRFAEILLWVGCVGVAVAFGGGLILAFAACVDQLLVEVTRLLKIRETLSLCLGWALKTRDQIYDSSSLQINEVPQSSALLC